MRGGGRTRLVSSLTDRLDDLSTAPSTPPPTTLLQYKVCCPSSASTLWTRNKTTTARTHTEVRSSVITHHYKLNTIVKTLEIPVKINHSLCFVLFILTIFLLHWSIFNHVSLNIYITYKYSVIQLLVCTVMLFRCRSDESYRQKTNLSQLVQLVLYFLIANNLKFNY